MIFNVNTPQDLRNIIASHLHIAKMDAPNKFLGLPTDIPKSKTQIFSFIKYWILNKTMGWKEQMLFKGGREVLIKAVLTTIPVYVISVFKIPSSICQAINSMIFNF